MEPPTEAVVPSPTVDAGVAMTATATDTTGPAVAPLAVPWLHHDSFATVKKVCHPGGMMHAKKPSIVRVLQELKRGRAHAEQQLASLEAQLLLVSDFINGTTNALELSSGDAQTGTRDASAVANGVLPNGASAASGGGVEPDQGAKGPNAHPVSSIATLVEEDLASETPCTTVGLWRYLSFFSYFKAVTLDDMQEALLLEDAEAAVAVESADGSDDGGNHNEVTMNGTKRAHPDLFDLPALDDFPVKKHKSEASVNELLQLRLLAALIPEATCEGSEAEGDTNGDTITDDNIGNGKASVEEVLPEPLNRGTTLGTNRTLLRLRDVGLIEESNELLTKSLQHPHDDEVSEEIRFLQSELVGQVRRNNEFKRTLRLTLERVKPWLTHDEERQQIETKFLKMWHRKKELQRKKKHKEKKLQRKEASYKSAFAAAPAVPSPSPSA